jgi:hypothetical protein
MVREFLLIDSYFGEDEDEIDQSLVPEKQSGQFAFGSTDPSAQQQFNFGDDVNMS